MKDKNISHLNLCRVFLLGISSGLPLVLVLSTFGVWLVDVNVSKTTIGLFALATTPYSLKFLWSPFIDGIRLPGLHKVLGHRKSWLMLSQAGLVVTIVTLSSIDPAEHLFLSAVIVLAITFCSATQDIVIDAYRIELATDKEQGMFATFLIYGYRIGMLISGAGALFLASSMEWHIVYKIMAGIMAIIALLTLSFPETQKNKESSKTSYGEWIKQYVFYPFLNFTKNDQFILILIFIILYKFGDAFAGIMTNPFLLEQGFDKIDIASIVKTIGLGFTMLGLSIGGIIVAKVNLKNALIFCGVLQALSNLMFCVQTYFPGDKQVLMLTIGLENLTGAMGTVAFVAFISKLCHKNYTATQYALLSSFASFGRTFFSSGAGIVADNFNWIMFFSISTILAIPGIVMLLFIKNNILDKKP
ncbi:MAG: AmpG family muropeptide MFS transporter [Rickettsiales bacterium]|jgi:MFS transporter, PAT family, beta-lactamase induction signal transducer AmpG|nr:AmpG family muropeptide MFS transporter [Rickettsiales bacterium]